MRILTAENHVGRLLEFRVMGHDMQAEEYDLVMEEWKEASASAAKVNGKIVVIADMRGLQVMGPNVRAATERFIKGDNERLERSAIFGPAPGVFTLQLDRLRREAPHSNRRVFNVAEELYRWLGEVLTGVEQARLKHFIELRNKQRAI